MAAPFAFVTLITSDSYLPGALALAGALKDLHPKPPVAPEVDFQTVCLVTPETVDVSTVKLLRRAFNVVVGVELIAQENSERLILLGRPDLNAVLTKLHIFRLTQYSKLIFLDADVLPVRPLSHLFTLPHEFSAVPDVGWPDIFNSGVLVLSPGEDKFTELNTLLKSKGSWDGGDQGLLNEWRGGNWNRLSFTYNTTPTAAYTYAPAYERFGSKISAIHFIGPNKPWNAIPYRAPGSGSTQEAYDSAGAQTAYDYSSLVDRWFAVYDRHYRSHAVVPESEFEVRRYVSAWDEQSATDAELVAASSAPIGGTLGLEDLRRLAVEGMSTASVVSDDRGGEGEYQSLPLEGRVDLMRPRQEEKQPGPEPEPEQQYPDPITEQEQQQQYQQHHYEDHGSPSTPVQRRPQLPEESPARFETLPTPGPSELPPAPHPVALSLPPSIPPSPSPQPFQPQPVYHHDQRHEEPQQQRPVERPRPSSPPLLVWNPAVEPPPKSTPTPSAFPTDTYFPNVWDQSPTKHNDEAHQSYSSPEQPSDSRTFFQPPPPSEIPESLLRQGHYRNVTGPLNESDPAASPSPDRTKVKSVFPWEQKPRHFPGRVFPTSDSPPPGALFIQNQSGPSPPVATPERLGPPPATVIPSPLVGLPSTLTYANAWDTVPSIQKYASRLVRPPPAPAPAPAPLAPAFEGGGRRRRGSERKWEEKAEMSSMDGDVEDEGDDDEPKDVGTRRDESENESPTTKRAAPRKKSSRGGSRTGSTSPRSNVVQGGKKKEYRTQGVQTIPKETRNQGIQVDTTSAKTIAPQLSRPEPTKVRPKSASVSGKRTWTPATGANLLPPVVVQDIDILPDQTAMVSPAVAPPPRSSVSFPSMTTEPSGMRSPRDFTYTPPSHSPAQAITPPRLTDSPLENQRKLSNETVTSASSAGPASPSEGQPILPPQRKAGRVFDPARGVELFKRGSEEVLARFLSMGSWEEDGHEI